MHFTGFEAGSASTRLPTSGRSRHEPQLCWSCCLSSGGTIPTGLIVLDCSFYHEVLQQQLPPTTYIAFFQIGNRHVSDGFDRSWTSTPEATPSKDLYHRIFCWLQVSSHFKPRVCRRCWCLAHQYDTACISEPAGSKVSSRLRPTLS